MNVTGKAQHSTTATPLTDSHKNSCKISR